jgi:hypothetical protein
MLACNPLSSFAVNPVIKPHFMTDTLSFQESPPWIWMHSSPENEMRPGMRRFSEHHALVVATDRSYDDSVLGSGKLHFFSEIFLRNEIF